MNMTEGIPGMSRQRRRLPIWGVFVLIAVVALTAGAIAATRDPGGGSDVLTGAPGDPITCDPLAPTQPYCLREPDPTSTTIDATSPQVTTPAPPGSLAVPLVTLAGADGPLNVTVDISPPNASAGQIVQFSLRSIEPGERERAVGANFGDGGPYGLPGTPHGECNEEAATTTVSTPPNEEATQLYEHAYRLPGRYNVQFRVVTARCFEASRTVDLKGTVVVGPGVLLSNGPLPPQLVGAGPVGQATAGTPVDFNAHVRDFDGFVSSVVIRWGDGTNSTKSYPRSSCTDPKSRWPGPSSDTFIEKHSYSASGTYEVTLTIVSVGCTGLDQQTATGTIPVVVAD